MPAHDVPTTPRRRRRPSSSPRPDSQLPSSASLRSCNWITAGSSYGVSGERRRRIDRASSVQLPVWLACRSSLPPFIRRMASHCLATVSLLGSSSVAAHPDCRPAPRWRRHQVDDNETAPPTAWGSRSCAATVFLPVDGGGLAAEKYRARRERLLPSADRPVGRAVSINLPSAERRRQTWTQTRSDSARRRALVISHCRRRRRYSLSC